MPVFIAVIALFGGFESIFITFHQIFFRDATWLFDPATDPVINILPERYFMLCHDFGVVISSTWSVLSFKTKGVFQKLI